MGTLTADRDDVGKLATNAATRILAGLIAALFVFSCLSLVTLDEDEGPTHTPQQVLDLAEPATTTTTTKPPFVDREGGFSVVFPIEPARDTQPFTEQGVSLEMTMFSAIVNDEALFVGYLRAPEALEDLDSAVVLDATIDEAAKNVDGTVTSRTRTTHLGHPAQDAVIEVGETTARARAILVGNVMYMLVGTTGAKATPSPHYDRLVATFTLLGS